MPADHPPPPDLRRLLRPIQGRLAVAVALQAVASVLVLAPLIGVGELARVLLTSPVDQGRATAVVVVSAVLLGLGFALRGVADLITHLADNSFTLALRRSLAGRLAAAPLGWFTEHASGQIKQGMQDDVAALHHLIGHWLTNVTAAVITPLAAYAYLFWLDWRLALLMLIPVPVFLAIYRWMMAGSSVKMREYGQVLAQVNNSVVEFVNGIPVVKAFGQTGRAHQAYRTAADRFAAFYLAWVRPLMRPESTATAILSPVTMVLLALGGGTALVAAGAMAPVDVLPFILLGMAVSAPVTTLATGNQALQVATGAAARISALLAVPSEPQPQDPRSPAGTVIEFDRVRFSYDGSHDVLDDVSGRIEPGTVTAVVGASGSGKSTLARLLLRFHRPSGGTIRLGGVPLDRIAAADLYRLVGAVFQDVVLLRISVAENIALGRPGAAREEIVAAARAANIHDRIMDLPRGYDSVPGEDAAFSGGEAQRLGVARAMLLDPPILVLDEPTSAADAEAERAVQDAVSVLVSSDPRRSVLVIAHRLETVTRVDEILVLAGGRVVERGRHQELLAAGGEYAALWHAQHPSMMEAQ